MIGKTINQYKVLEKLGGGGMGVVYKAQDRKLERLVALKFLPPHLGHDDDEKKRFIHEAKAASALEHNNICNVHDIDETDDGQLFIAMAYYAGETIKKKIERGLLPISEALDLALQIAKGLDKAHNNGILHRDIKPANIMVTEDGIAKIVDFGLAKLADKTKLTKTGSTVGTVAYMSPEQGSGSKVDARSDLWSLGVVLYEMLTGQLPFQGDYEQAVIYSILNLQPQLISELRNDLPEGLESVVKKCLEKEPEDRYDDIQRLQSELVRLVEAGKSNKQVSPNTKKPVLRSPFKIALSVALVVLLAAIWGGVPFDWQSVGRWLGFTMIPAEKHVAVLPFTTWGEDPYGKTFSAGLVESLTSKLTQMEQFKRSLWVLPAGEIFKSEIQSAHEAWQKFKVRLAFSGILQNFGGKTRLTLNLEDAKVLRRLDSKVINISTSNLFALQDTVSVLMASMLDIDLERESRRVLNAGGTSKAMAYKLYLQGRGFLQDYNERLTSIDNSISLFEEALEQDPDYALANASLGEAYWLKYRVSRDVQWVKLAQFHCDKALRMAENLWDAHYTRGLIHSGIREFDSAILDFKKTIELNPASDEAHRQIAWVYTLSGRPEIAESHYRKAIDLAPQDWENFSFLGAHYSIQDSLHNAAEQFQKVVALRPDIVKGHKNLGGVYFLLEKWEEAKTLLNHALDLQPDRVTYSQLGTIHFYELDFALAAEMFEKAREMAREDHRFWGYMAAAYLWIPKEDESRKLSKTAAELAERELEVNPNDPGLLCDLASYYANMRNDEKAISYLTQAQEVGIKNADLSFQVCEIYEQLGKRDIALHWLSKALDKGKSMNIVNRSPYLTNLRSNRSFMDLIDARSRKTAE